MSETSIAMQREIEAAKALRLQIEAITGDDPDFMRDTIEGETNIRELIGKLVAEEGEDAALIDGISKLESSISARKDRFKKRIELRRAMIGSALEIAELQKLETPSGTVALRKVQPVALVQDEAGIPARFWKAGKPTLDKTALKEALKSGEAVPGATLSNGSITTHITRN